MYQSIDEIQGKLINIKNVKWDIPFELYHKNEQHKWKGDFHFEAKKKDYKILEWFEGDIKLSDLFDIKMHKGADWIKKLSCGIESCEFHGTECDCKVSENSEVPTLRKVISNIYNNAHLESFKEIEELKEAIKNGEVDLYIIIRNDIEPYLVDDGNHRLIALTILYSENLNSYSVRCYLGYKP